MTILIPNEGELLLLEAMIGKTAAGNLILALYTSNTTPADTDALATYTEMGAVQGYTSKTLTMASWASAVAGTGSGTSLSNKASIAYAQQVWTFDGTGGAQNVYGYFMKNAGATKLAGAERFASAPIVVSLAGDTIKITPQLTLSRE